MSALFACEHPAAWRSAFGKYWDAVEAKSKSKKAGKLLHLDKWYQEELPKLISSRPDKHVTQSELVKLMEWKLTRGKFRPRLQQLVASNGESTVEKCSRKAFGLLPDVQAAMAELCCLKGVGPATASAVLAAGAPEEAAFMSDEAMESVPGLKPVQYTAKHYALYLGKMVERTEKLNHGEIITGTNIKKQGSAFVHHVSGFDFWPLVSSSVDPQQDWTPHRVELCLWAWTTAKLHQPPSPEEVGVEVKASSGTKKKCPDVQVEQSRPTKKLKTR